MSSVIKAVVKKHIKNTTKKAYVKELTLLLCHITKAVKEQTGRFPTSRVYITTKTLKHMYDKRPAEEFDFITSNLPILIKFPTRIYKNKDDKTGGLCFYKEIKEDAYFCILEVNGDINPIDGEIGMNYIVTTYRLSEEPKKRENYLSGYELLWSWKDDIPSS